MKAAFIHEPGPATSIVYGDLPDPVAGPGQVLLRTECVTVDHIDTFIRGGAYPQTLPAPFIIGRDVVGVVIGLGAGSSKFAIGERVWANNQGYAGRQGSFAETLAVDEALLYPLPAGVEPENAVALLHSMLTVSVGLLGKAHLQAGETVFLRGGSGSVGNAALQVARQLGCRVAVTGGSESKIAVCRELGADSVINYRDASWEDQLRDFAPEGVNVYWDLTTSPDLSLALNHTARRGRILLSSGLKEVAQLPIGPFYTRNLSLLGFTVTDQTPEELEHWSRAINTYLPLLRAPIDQVLPLSRAAEAHARVETGQVAGKLVLRPD